MRVTTLAARGPGSLRAALTFPAPRLIVFEVGGVIDLHGDSLSIKSPYVTIAGQTAPDPGITIIRGSLVAETHDVVVQHIAVRPGDGGATPGNQWAPDALGAHRGSTGPVHDVVFDHCSATWSVDENLSASGPADTDADSDSGATAHDITLRDCLIAEALSHSTHPKGEHSKGTLVHDGVRNVAIIHCLYAHNTERNPRLKGGTTTFVSGNVMYNWASACVGVGVRGNRRMLRPAEAVLEGNVAIAGPDTRNRVFVKSVDAGGRVFLRDNIALSPDGKPLRMTDDRVVEMTACPGWASPCATTGSATETLMHVLRSAGSRPSRRDPIDARIVQSVISGGGRIIDSQQEAGGYPIRPAATQTLVVPDGVEERRKWLDKLSNDLAEDRALNITPLLDRLRVPSPDWRR